MKFFRPTLHGTDSHPLEERMMLDHAIAGLLGPAVVQETLNEQQSVSAAENASILVVAATSEPNESTEDLGCVGSCQLEAAFYGLTLEEQLSSMDVPSYEWTYDSESKMLSITFHDLPSGMELLVTAVNDTGSTTIRVGGIAYGGEAQVSLLVEGATLHFQFVEVGQDELPLVGHDELTSTVQLHQEFDIDTAESAGTGQLIHLRHSECEDDDEESGGDDESGGDSGGGGGDSGSDGGGGGDSGSGSSDEGGGDSSSSPFTSDGYQNSFATVDDIQSAFPSLPPSVAFDLQRLFDSWVPQDQPLIPSDQPIIPNDLPVIPDDGPRLPERDLPILPDDGPNNGQPFEREAVHLGMDREVVEPAQQHAIDALPQAGAQPPILEDDRAVRVALVVSMVVTGGLYLLRPARRRPDEGTCTS